MASNIVRMPPGAPQGRVGMPAPRTGGGAPLPQGNWWWDGTQWVCGCDPDDVPPWPCPPPGWPPPGCPPWWSGQSSPPWYPGANAGVSFGTAGNYPANPVRGHFFWDGSHLWMFDGAVWVSIPAATPQGITDGSLAAAGAVGEVINSTVSGAFPVTIATANPVSSLVVTPGDWDVQSTATLTVTSGTTLQGASFLLNPLPTGFSTNMSTIIGNQTVGASPQNALTMSSPVARASVAVPTLMAFTLTTNTTAAGGSGTWSFFSRARRMR